MCLQAASFLKFILSRRNHLQWALFGFSNDMGNTPLAPLKGGVYSDAFIPPLKGVRGVFFRAMKTILFRFNRSPIAFCLLHDAERHPPNPPQGGIRGMCRPFNFRTMLLLQAVILVLLYFSPLLAQQPKIRALLAQPQDGRIAAHVQLENLFSPKITSTIRSGLPVIIRCDFRLQTGNGREVARAVQSVQVLFDIWTQRYRLTLLDSNLFVSTFEEMEKTFAKLELAAITSHDRLDSALSYRLRLRVTVIPISAEQGKQLLQRLESNDLRSESTASESGRSGFSVNLSSLLSFFLSGEERAHGASDWASSSTFRLTKAP